MQNSKCLRKLKKITENLTKTKIVAFYTPAVNLFIYQAREVYPGPSRVSDSPVSAENVIYEAFGLVGGIW